MKTTYLAAGVALAIAAGLVGSPHGAAAAVRADAPAPGLPGIGDRLFPTLGNGGYDAKHYDLSLTYPTSKPEQQVSGTVTMLARATQSLSRFNLDFSGDSIAAVRVGGEPAGWAVEGQELVITPKQPLAKDAIFTTTVQFESGPFTPAAEDELPIGWFTTADGSVVGAQPDAAHSIFPTNDHPADKATYSIRLDVPSGVNAVANGELVRRVSEAGRVRSIYLMDRPMAPELIQIAVGKLDVIDRGLVRGVHVRDVAPSALAAGLEPVLARTPDHLRWLTDRIGRYPFRSYGSLVVDQRFFYALETQTLSLYPAFLMGPDYPLFFKDPIMVHELAHQWFGDDVAPRQWSDLWLNEGHATWYEWLYGNEFFVADEPGYELLPRLKEAYSHGDQWRTRYGPVAQPLSGAMSDLFSPNVYDGGAVVLYALRQEIGVRAFEALERRWAQESAGTSVGTADFIALASRVAGRDLGPFLSAWLYGTRTPPMPGHPDWTVLPSDAPLRTSDTPDARTVEQTLAKH